MYDAACNACGVVEFLTVHHIVPRSMGGQDEVTNYSILCQTCHNLVHWVRPLDSIPLTVHRMQKGSHKLHRAQRMVDRIAQPEVREVIDRLRLVINIMKTERYTPTECIKRAFEGKWYYEWLQEKKQLCLTDFAKLSLTMDM